MTKLLSAMLAVLLLVAGCATQTAYKPAEKRGAEGYTETRLGESRYRISFVGNTQTKSETVKDYALLRAAELSLQQGYEWFQVIERDGDKKVNAATSIGSGFSVPGHTSVYRSCGALSCRTTVASSPGFSTGFGVSSTTTTTAYSYAIEVMLGRAPMARPDEAYDARELATNIRNWMAANQPKT